MLSLKAKYDPSEHIKVGKALAQLRDTGGLIIGSGLSYHNMQCFGDDKYTPTAEAFGNYLLNAISQLDASACNDMLVNWENGPGARFSHPREDHLIPLMVTAGAAQEDIGRLLFIDHVMKIPMTSYEFGGN